jgi:hypothetical protein
MGSSMYITSRPLLACLRFILHSYRHLLEISTINSAPTMEHHTTTRVCNMKDESSVKTGEQKMLYLLAKLRGGDVPFPRSRLHLFRRLSLFLCSRPLCLAIASLHLTSPLRHIASEGRNASCINSNS